MQTRDGNPWQARALRAEMALEAERELRIKAEKGRSRKWAQARHLQSAERRESRAARAILQRHESQVSSIAGMAHPSSRYSDESNILEQFMLRWQKEDWVELMLRVLARQPTEDGEGLTFWIESCDSFGPALQAIIDQRDMEIHDQLTMHAYRPEKAILMRLLLKTSWNKLEVMRSCWRWDHNATDAQGNRCRMREMLAPGSKLPAPDPFDTARMRQWEGSALKTGYKDCPLRNRQHDDLHGAEVTDVDWVLRQAIIEADRGVCGGMATSGTEIDPHWILITGDGANLTADDSGTPNCCCGR